MATSGGPDIVRNGLVFGMDTGYGVADNNTSTKFYLGKPTTNAFTYSNFTPAGYGGDGVLQTGALDPFGTTDNPVYRKTGKLRFGPTDGTDVGTLYYGNTYTFSIYLRHVPGETQTTSAEFDINDRTNSINYVGDLGSNMTFEWKRFSVTALHNNSSNYHFIDIGVYQGSNVYEWCCPQIDEGSIATPFISNGTIRSSTKSLIDLTKTTDIDVSNVSFDSTGQPTFDGTSDMINMGNLDVIRLGTNFTIECVVRPEQDKWMYFFWKGYGSNNSLAWGRHSSSDNWFFSTMIGGSYQNSYMGTATLNKYCHLVATYNGSNLKLYENSILRVTSAKTHDMMTSTSELQIGGGGRYWNGKIPVTKVYNQVLSDQEIKQNFNAYKNRFDI